MLGGDVSVLVFSKQKTAYEMRISDWSSDVCSSDLAALRHIGSALARLADGGRLVAITGANFAPDAPAWRDAYVRLQERGHVVFSAAIDGRVYAKHEIGRASCRARVCQVV